MVSHRIGVLAEVHWVAVPADGEFNLTPMDAAIDPSKI